MLHLLLVFSHQDEAKATHFIKWSSHDDEHNFTTVTREQGDLRDCMAQVDGVLVLVTSAALQDQHVRSMIRLANQFDKPITYAVLDSSIPHEAFPASSFDFMNQPEDTTRHRQHLNQTPRPNENEDRTTQGALEPTSLQYR